MSQKIKVLLVEDDTNLGFLLVDFLESNGFDVKLYPDGEAGLKAFKNDTFQFCIFDVMLPGIDGFSIMKEVRELNETIPVLFLTARSMKQDKIKGFNLGADDYITKPFDEDELLCRINAIINRSNYAPKNNTVTSYSIGFFQFIHTDHKLIKDDNEYRRLTQTEAEVLRVLCASKNKIVKRDDLLNKVWGNNDYFNGRSLDVFIVKLRKYLKDDVTVQIENIPKLGYILKDNNNDDN